MAAATAASAAERRHRGCGLDEHGEQEEGRRHRGDLLQHHASGLYAKNPVRRPTIEFHRLFAAERTCGSSTAITRTAMAAMPSHSTVVTPVRRNEVDG